MVETLNLNGLTLTRAFEWQDRLLTRPQLIPGSDRAAWEQNRSWLVPEFWDPETEDAWVCSQSLVVESGGATILIDTGIGNAKIRPSVPPFDNLDTGFLDTLRAAGADPADVDIVINTHIHIDHVGGNTRLEGDTWVPTFPNATYLIPRADFEHLNSRGSGEPDGSPDEAQVFSDSVLPVVNAGLAQFYEGTHVIDEHVTLEAAAGHTPGFSIVRLRSGSEQAIFAGDVFHSPMQIVRPHDASCFDDDPVAAVSARERILAQAVELRAPILTNHIPTARAAAIARRDGRYVIDGWVDYS